MGQSAVLEEFPENKFPDCLFLKISGANSQTHKSDVYLTISFNVQQVSYKIGSVWFALKSGDLILEIKNGQAPYEFRSFSGGFIKKFKAVRKVEEAGFHGCEKENVIGSNYGAKLGVHGNLKNVTKQGEKLSLVDTFEHNVYQITTKGTENIPVWSFNCLTDDPYLANSMVDEKLCEVFFYKKPCSINAKFIVSKKDIVIIYAENFWANDISENKKSIIKLIMLRSLLEEINGYLARDFICHE